MNDCLKLVDTPSDGAWASEDDVWESYRVADAIPLFVLARFLVAAGEHVDEPDFADASRRIAAWEELPFDAIRGAYRRACRLAEWIAATEATPGSAAPAGPTKPGSAVVLNKSGVGIVVAVEDGMPRVAMLGRPKRPVVRFATAMARTVKMPDVGRVLLAELPSDLLGG